MSFGHFLLYSLAVVTCVIIVSSSGASMYNFNDEEEDDDGPTKEKVEENEQLKEKMKQVRLKMDKLNISKKVGVIVSVRLSHSDYSNLYFLPDNVVC